MLFKTHNRENIKCFSLFSLNRKNILSKIFDINILEGFRKKSFFLQ